jgi:aminomethyltransferase
MKKPVVRATPFHARAAAANLENAWIVRNGTTLSTAYGDSNDEALAARLRVAMADISWRWRILLEGARVAEFLSKLVTRDVTVLSPGTALKALWLSDNGGVRGAGAIARYGRESFLLAASAPDREWISAAAASYDVKLNDRSDAEGGLAIVGPYAQATVEAAQLTADLEPLSFRKLSWRSIDVTLSRFGEHGGYEIWCAPDDGMLVWDRIARAGENFGIEPAGIAAMDLLDLEAGIMRPERDYEPARDGNASSPNPVALGLESLIDPEHRAFNGRNAYLAAREKESRRLVGIEIDSDVPAPFTPLLLKSRAVGHTLRSVWSPSLRRAIALAEIDVSAFAPGTTLTLTLPTSSAMPELRSATARVTALPFLPVPVPIVR